ncbi:MAG TPA: hypothetical protein VG942_02460 [Hyphomonadaceae bacterium]|nr:hypothetical protein [Hyphomonadaceae bacterium]
MRVLVLASMIVLVAACTKEGAGPTDPSQAKTSAPPAAAANVQVASAPQQAGGAPPISADINWDAARADKAKAPASAAATIQSVGSGEPSPVPMLLPSGVVQIQSADDRPTPPVVTKDGYFATYHLPKYDAIVNGSATSYSGGQKATGDKEKMKFTTGEAGASLAFSRYGADYLIEFECRQVDGANTCVTEQEAKDFADSLFVAQTR